LPTHAFTIGSGAAAEASALIVTMDTASTPTPAAFLNLVRMILLAQTLSRTDNSRSWATTFRVP
jgi:hypothetical protein